MNFWTICHRSFHLGFLSPKAWFCTLNKVLSNNNSFNKLFILTCKMGLVLFICTFGYLILTLWVLDLNNKTLLLPANFYVVSFLLLLEILIGLFQINYDTLLFQSGLLHFGIISCHPFQIKLKMNKIIMGLPIELIEFNIFLLQCRNGSLGLATKVRVGKGAGQEWSSGITFHAHGSVGKCEGMNPHTPKWAPTLGLKSPDGLLNFQRAIIGVKSHWIEELFIPLKIF